MPKSIIIEPEKVFARGAIHLSDIQVNAYQRTGEQERATYSSEEFLAIWQDMCAIRQFETILNEIKTKGVLNALATLKTDRKTMIVDNASNENLRLSIRNSKDHQFLPPEGVNVYDLLRHDTLVLSKDAAKALELRCLDRGAEK